MPVLGQHPSIILVRELLALPVDRQGDLLATNLDQIRGILAGGAIVVLTRSALRVRPLPIRESFCGDAQGARRGHAE